ncbi:tetratricopeptide repeat protein [Leptolyngbya sp. AN03gr2]|uniref:tetratricopeptide repeat protein n=1 Tax=unclassified Leptolyngbya TaxID=2650499 RepID=UPI003D314235
MPDRSILASLLGLLITTSLPIVPAQAQVNLSCSQRISEDFVRRLPYPNQPLPAIVATNSVSRSFAELNEIAQSPVSSNLIVQNYLDRWLIGRPFAVRPDTPTSPQLDLLLKELSQPSEKIQLLGILDRLAARIEQLSDEQIKYRLMAGLARYYQRLGASDRATTVLTRGIQASLKQSNARSRTSQLGGLLVTASELKQTPKIAGLLGQAESAIVATMQSGQTVPLLFQVTVPLTLAQSYLEANQPAKTLQIVDRVTKFAPATQLNPDIARLYLQLKREDKARPYLNKILKDRPYVEDSRYLALAAVSNDPKILAIAWEAIKTPSFDFDPSLALQAYFQAGGNPDRIAQLLRSSPADVRALHLLIVAGEYRKRNQTQKASQAIEQFIQAVRQAQNYNDGAYLAGLALRYGYLPEANTALRRSASLNLISPRSYVIPIAQELKALDAIESAIQRFPNTEPEERLYVLQQFAIAYASQNANKAISLAQQLPLQNIDSSRSPRIEALAQIGVQDRSALELATKLAESLTNPKLKAITYGAIARGYIKIGQEQSAESARQTAVKAAKALPINPNTGFTPNYALSFLSQQFLNDDQVEPAWKTLQEIPKEAFKETNFNNLIIKALQVGQLNIAQQAAELIYTNQKSDEYLSISPRLAQAYISRGRTSEAIAVLDRAAALLNGRGAQSAGTYIEVIQLLAQVARIETARQLLAKYPEPGASGKLRRQELQSYIDCYAQRGSRLR